MIEFEDVSMTLGDFSLDGVSLSIGKGDYYFIIGPSGAGKTVILEAIAGLHTPGSGRILLRGEDVSALPPEKRSISLVYQDYSLFPHMTVEENIAYGLKRRKITPEESKKRVDAALSSFGIESLRTRHPYTMSGGEQQRCALARALVVQPEILLLDEPLSALDPVTRERMIFDLSRLHKESGLTIVHVSHSRDEAIRLASRVAVIIDGRLAGEGGVEEVFSSPRRRDVAHFVGVENILDGEVEESREGVVRIRTDGAVITAVSDASRGVHISACIRAEDVALSLSSPEDTSMRNVFKGHVLSLLPAGPVARVTIDCGFLLTSLILKDTAANLGIVPGREVFASFKATAVTLTEPEDS